MRSGSLLLSTLPLALTGLLTGCALTPLAPSADSASGLSGSVHGGQQPVAGATITLYAPGTTGYGSAPTALVSTVSDANGAFTLPRPYACPATNDNITYLVARGGNPGAGTNAVISEVALLGPCASLSAASFVSISEVTTVAAAYTLAPFSPSTTGIGGGVNTNPGLTTVSIGTSATNLIGLKNALGPAGNLANTSNGYARAANEIPNMILPTAEMNTLADILAACVNSTGSTLPTAPCGQLFAASTPPNSSAPSDTFAAMIDIALNPGNNVAALYALSSAAAPFQPSLTANPGDFALGIQYTGGQIAASGFTSGLAIDSQGNAWVGNGVGNNGNPKSVSKITPAGVFLSGPNGYANGIAGGNGYSIDASDNVFIAVSQLSEVIELNQAGTIIKTIAAPSFVKPLGLVVDNRNNSVWTANANNQPSLAGGNNDFIGNTVSNVTTAGVDIAGSPYTGANGPDGVQEDALGDIWVANSGNNTVNNNGFLTKYIPPAVAGNPYTVQNVATGLRSFPFDLAIDNGNNVWVPFFTSLAKYSNAGVLLSGTGFTSAANNSPVQVIFDGLNRAFVSNQTDSNGNGPGALTVFSNTGTLLSTSNGNKGYLANNTINNLPFIPCGIAIDPSGNVWITGITTAANGLGYVTELIGIAAPIVTPTTVANSTNRIGIRP